MEKQRLAALAAEEQRLKQRKRDEGFMREALRQAKKAASIGDVPTGTMPHVCRSDCAGAYTQDCGGMHESQGRLRGVRTGYAPCAGI